MPKVVDNKQIGPMVWKMLVNVPRLVSKAKAGQFVILRINEHGERVPMSIAGLDKEKGLLTIIYQVVGKTSALMTATKLLLLLGPGQKTFCSTRKNTKQ